MSAPATRWHICRVCHYSHTNARHVERGNTCDSCFTQAYARPAPRTKLGKGKDPVVAVLDAWAKAGTPPPPLSARQIRKLPRYAQAAG